MEIVDALVVTLGLDPKEYIKGQSQALVSLKKTGEQATTTAKDMQARGDQAATFFSKVRNEALGLMTVLVGGKGLVAFTTDAVRSMSDLGSAAHDIGIGVPQLAALRNMIEASGGNADAATASFQNLAQAMAKAKQFGPSNELATFLTHIGSSLTDPIDEVYKRFNQWAQGKSPQEVITLGQMGGLDIGTIREAMKSVAAFQKDMADAMKRGVPNPGMTDNMIALESAFTKTQQAAKLLGDTILDKLAPGLTIMLNNITGFISEHPVMATGAGAAVGLGGMFASWFGLKSLMPGLFGGGAAAGAESGAAAAAAAAAAKAAPAAAEGLLAGRLLGLGAIASGIGSFLYFMRPSHTQSQEEENRAMGRTRLPQTGAGQIFSSLEEQYRLPPGLIDSVWAAESSRGTNLSTSSAQAKGHFQFIDSTAESYGLFDPKTGRDDRYDLSKSAAGAAKYLSDLRNQFGGDIRKAISAYNWGPDRLGGDISRNGDSWDRFMPNETTNYLRKVYGGIGNGASRYSAAGSNQTSMSIGSITIHTAATDAAGISKDIGQSLRDYGFIAQANTGVF